MGNRTLEIAMAAGLQESETRQATILVADDERSMREMLAIVLQREGHRVLLADGGRAAVDLLRREPVDLLVSDIRMPDMSGVDVLREAKQVDPELIGIMITAFASTESAVEALRLGAHDYLSKPFDVAELTAKVREALEHRWLKEENAALKKVLVGSGDFTQIIGNSAAIQELKARISLVAPTNKYHPRDRRVGHGEGTRGAGDPRSLDTTIKTVCCGQLRCPSRIASRVRTVRSSAWKFHGGR